MKKLLSTFTTAFFMFTSTVSAAPMTLNVHDADLKSTIMLVARAGNLNVSVDDSIEGIFQFPCRTLSRKKFLRLSRRLKI